MTEPELVRIDGGWFTMGSGDGPGNERPAHRVWVDAFELARFQVTNAEYAEFLEGGGEEPPPSWHDPLFDAPRQPVVAVSWLDAVRYCEWLSSVTGRHFRLPTEAEWERAARGGVEGARYPWGDDPPESRPLTGPVPVGLGAPNAFGLYDVCENVHEWCSDWYAADFYAASPERNPRGPASGTRRVSRGGSWRHRVQVTRCAARSSLPPESRYTDYGFRVACGA